MEVYGELGKPGFVSQNVSVNSINQHPCWWFLSELLIIIVIIHIVAYSDKLLAQIRTSQ